MNGICQIIRNDTIESVIFCRPKLFVASYAHLARRHDTSVLDVCPRDDATIKLQMWQETALELCQEVMEAEWADEGSALKVFFANFGRKNTQILNAVTIALNILILIFYVPGKCTLCQEKFGDDHIVFILFMVLAPLHVLIASLGVGSWIVVRAPVLLFRLDREEEISLKQSDAMAMSRDVKAEESDNEEEGNDEESDDEDNLTNLDDMVDDLKEMIGDLQVGSMPIMAIDGAFIVVEKIPFIGTYFRLKYEPEFITQIIYIVTSVLGLFLSPLFYAFHLFPAAYNKDLELVLSSITSNTRRLTSVAVFLGMTMCPPSADPWGLGTTCGSHES